MNYALLIAAIIAEVIGTSFMKQSEGFTKLVPSLITITTYTFAYYCLSITMKSIPTGIAYAIWSGFGIILIAAIAWIFHGQKLDMAAVIGMALIIAGVLVMNVFSKSAENL